MNRATKELIKTLLGVPMLMLYRPLKQALIHAQRLEVKAKLGHCEPDLELIYPWDIRGGENIFIGRDVFIGPEVLMIADTGAEIHIGDKVMLGPRVRIIASDHRYDDPERAIRDSGYDALTGVRIGNDVWLGTGATVLKGIRVGEGVVVGAGSVVTRDIDPFEVWAGNPARKIKDRFPARQTVTRH